MSIPNVSHATILALVFNISVLNLSKGIHQQVGPRDIEPKDNKQQVRFSATSGPPFAAQPTILRAATGAVGLWYKVSP